MKVAGLSRLRLPVLQVLQVVLVARANTARPRPLANAEDALGSLQVNAKSSAAPKRRLSDYTFVATDSPTMSSSLNYSQTESSQGMDMARNCETYMLHLIAPVQRHTPWNKHQIATHNYTTTAKRLADLSMSFKEKPVICRIRLGSMGVCSWR